MKRALLGVALVAVLCGCSSAESTSTPVSAPESTTTTASGNPADSAACAAYTPALRPVIDALSEAADAGQVDDPQAIRKAAKTAVAEMDEGASSASPALAQGIGETQASLRLIAAVADTLTPGESSIVVFRDEPKDLSEVGTAVIQVCKQIP